MDTVIIGIDKTNKIIFCSPVCYGIFLEVEKGNFKWDKVTKVQFCEIRGPLLLVIDEFLV